MSRIGKKPVAVPKGVSVEVGGDRVVTVKGPKGSLNMQLRPEVGVSLDEGRVVVAPTGSGGSREARAFHGMTRALLQNMVQGVARGFDRTLRIEGVGWNASAQGAKVVLNIGFCHPVPIEMPAGVTVETPNPTTIVLRSADKQAVGHMAAVIRKVRPPEPYKGKGIRYENEVVRRKAGKSFGS
jgi:large subunit ribosomal protein L6